MESSKIVLVCLILTCYVSFGSSTIDENSCYPKIPCDDGACIDREGWCDYNGDCPDSSDEDYCETKSYFFTLDNNCDEELHFLCKNKKCVPVALRCDGFDDCGDKSDEKNCVEAVAKAVSPVQNTTGHSYSTTTESSTSPVNRIHSNNKITPPSVDHYSKRMEEGRNQQGFPSTRGNNGHYNGRPTSGYVTTPSHPGNNRQYNGYPASAFDATSSHPDNNRPYNGYPSSGFDATPSHPGNNRPYNAHRASGHDIPSSLTLYYPYSTPDTPHPHHGHWNEVSQGTPDARYTPPRASFPDRQQWPVIHQPRGVIHAQPHFRSVPRNKKARRSQPLPPFHFEVDRVQKLSDRYSLEIRRAEEWLTSQVESNPRDWGNDVPRALVALSLVRNSFLSNTTQYDILKRKLKLNLGGKLLRNNDQPMGDYQLALYVNALLSTCQDPRQIYERDLVSMLYKQIQDPRRRLQPGPFALLSLCIANSPITKEDLDILYAIVVDSTITDEVSKDRFILTTSALACVHKSGAAVPGLSGKLAAAERKLLDLQHDDGSFGTIYSTALAAQAFFALDSTMWREDKTLDFLSRHQTDDGSFGDMLATYYILPALTGRSLLHLRNTQCERPDYDEKTSEEDDWDGYGPTKNILYSLSIGYEQRNSIALHMAVPADASIFRIMKMAQRLDKRFKFRYAEAYGKLDVYSLSDIPNDPERGTYWNLYVLDGRNRTLDASRVYNGDIRRLVPTDFQELHYWYLPFKVNFP